jgi:hypothetical protein
MVHHRFRHASEQGMTEAGAAVCAHHNQVDMLILRGLQDGIRRFPR